MRISRMVVVPLVALLALPAGAADVDARKLRTAELKTQAGRKAYDGGDIAEARKQFEKALEVVSFYPEAHLGLGHILTKEKRFADALASYERAEEGFAALAKARQDQEAAADLKRRQDIEDLGQTQANRNRVKASGGFARTQELKTDTTIQNARQAPTPGAGQDTALPGEAYFFTGTALFQLGRVPEAMAKWKTCTEKSPEFAPAYNNLALGYWKLGQLKEAVDSLDRAEKLGLKVHPQLKADLHKAAAAAGVALPAGDRPPDAPAPAK